MVLKLSAKLITNVFTLHDNGQARSAGLWLEEEESLHLIKINVFCVRKREGGRREREK